MVKTTDPRAYELYLLAKQRMYTREFLPIQAAANMLDEAIAIDPSYAPAYAQRGIAAILLSVTSYGDTPDDIANAQAQLYLEKALELDPDQAEAWAGLGLLYNKPPPKTEEGIEALQKALELNPNLMDAANWLVLTYWSVNRITDSLALLDDMSSRDPLYKPAIGNRAFLLSILDRDDEARASLEAIAPFMPGDQQLLGTQAWIDFATGQTASALQNAQAALKLAPNDRTNRVSVNQGHYETHQYDKVIDDNWTGYYLSALFNLGRSEAANIEARRLADRGLIGDMFAYLNASDQSAALLQYFDQRWDSLAAFQQEIAPNGLFGYRPMADLAFAFANAGDQTRFDEALALLGQAAESSWAQGVRSGESLLVKAAYHVMSGQQDQALEYHALASDRGFIVSARISKEYPYFRELDGLPEYEAIQTRMIEHLNRERAKLDLEPISA